MRKRTSIGVTLLEAVIVMATLSVLVGIGLPSFKHTFERQQASSAVDLLSTYFAVARSSAISARLPVTTCPSLDGSRCSEDSDWSRGWIIYRDPTKARQPANAGAVLRWEDRTSASDIRLLSTPGRTLIRFLPDGRSAGTNLHIRACSGERLLAEVIVNNLGRVRSTRPSGNPPCA